VSEVARTGSERYGRTGPAVTALKLAGASFSEIADSLGLSSPQEALTLYLADLSTRVNDNDRAVLRAEANARLERLLRSTWRKATTERDPEHLAAVRVAQGLVDRIIKLNGLDAPTEIVVHSPTVSEIDQWVATVLAQGAAGMPDEADILDVEYTEEDQGAGSP